MFCEAGSFHHRLQFLFFSPTPESSASWSTSKLARSFVCCCRCRACPVFMSFFQRVVHHLVNEVLVSGLANRCDFLKSLRRKFFFFFGRIRPSLFHNAPFIFAEIFGGPGPRRMNNRDHGSASERELRLLATRGRFPIAVVVGKGKINSAGHSPERKKPLPLSFPSQQPDLPALRRALQRDGAGARQEEYVSEERMAFLIWLLCFLEKKSDPSTTVLTFSLKIKKKKQVRRSRPSSPRPRLLSPKPSSRR